MKCFDELKSINAQQNFYIKIFQLSLRSQTKFNAPSDRVAFLVLVDNFICLKHFQDTESLVKLRQIVECKVRSFSYAKISEETESLRYGKTFYGFISGGWNAGLNYDRIMSIFQDEAKILGVKAKELKQEMMPHIKLAIAYAENSVW